MEIRSRGLVLDKLHSQPMPEDVIVMDPGPGEVRIKLVASGICHTDLSMVRDARFLPMLLGHIAAVGAAA